jgi:hypothetical protein
MPSPENKKKTGFFYAYGGWKAVLSSRYVWWSFVATFAASPLALKPGWWDVVLTVSPSLAGFALGSFALLMSVGDEEFRRLLAGSDNGKPSPLMTTAATFTYFIIVQCLALGYAILAKAYYVEAPDSLIVSFPWIITAQRYAWIPWCLGVWLFAYSVSLTAAAAKALFSYVGWFDGMVTRRKKAEAENVAAPAEEASLSGQGESKKQN